MQLFFADSCPILGMAAISPAPISGMNGPPQPGTKGREKIFWASRPNRYLLHRFKKKSFKNPKEHENLMRFPGKDFLGLDFKADSLNFFGNPCGRILVLF